MTGNHSAAGSMITEYFWGYASGILRDHGHGGRCEGAGASARWRQLRRGRPGRLRRRGPFRRRQGVGVRDDGDLSVVEPAELRVDLDGQALGGQALRPVVPRAQRLQHRRGGRGRWQLSAVQPQDQQILDRLVSAQFRDLVRREAVGDGEVRQGGSALRGLRGCRRERPLALRVGHGDALPDRELLLDPEPEQPAQHLLGHLGRGELQLDLPMAGLVGRIKVAHLCGEGRGRDLLVAQDRGRTHPDGCTCGECDDRGQRGRSQGDRGAEHDSVPSQRLSCGHAQASGAAVTSGATGAIPPNTASTSSPHQVSRSWSRRSGAPGGAGVPGRLPDPTFGTGTSMLRTVGLSTVFGYSRWTRTSRESGSATGEKRMYVPCWVMSVSPARRASARSRATASRLSTGSGGGPYRSASSARTAAESPAESMAAIRV